MSVQSLGREGPLEKEMATHSSFLAWEIPWTEEPAGYSRWGHKELDMTEWLPFLSFPFFVLLRPPSEIHKISINLYVVITVLLYQKKTTLFT